MLQIVAASVPAVVRARFTLIAAVADLAGVFGSKSSWQQSAAKHKCAHDCGEELHIEERGSSTKACIERFDRNEGLCKYRACERVLAV
jgi:hypothetical protein